MVAVGVAVLSVIPFLPALQADFVAWDDDKIILENTQYRGLGLTQLRWMWSTFHMGHYMPLSWMTLGLDYSVWGMNPVGYHLSNLLLHAGNSVLVFFVARRLLRLTDAFAGKPDTRLLPLTAALAALLFAIHPLRVESVAWVTERRDVLSLFFYLASLLSYLRAAEVNGSGRRGYWGALALFVCALLSKGSAVSLPVVMLIVNVYPLRRVGGVSGWWNDRARQVFRELVPFALFSAAASILSLVALTPPEQLQLAGKAAVSAFSLAFYLWKTLAPFHLSPLYALPEEIRALQGEYLVGYAVAIPLMIVLWTQRRRSPGVTAALLVFLAIILPFLGVVQNGPQIAADRYTYHAAPALAILIAAGLAGLRHPSFYARGAIASIVLFGLAVVTWRQTRVWRDSETLWRHVVRLQPQSSLAHNNLGNVFVQRQRISDAVEQYRQAVAITPDFSEAHNNLGVALAMEGQLAEAIVHYRQAVASKPGYDDAHSNWGIALAGQGQVDLAIEQYRNALDANPKNSGAHTNWGNALARLGHHTEAIAHYQQAVAIQPTSSAHYNWGIALAQQDSLVTAIEHFRAALEINPAYGDASSALRQATQLLEHRREPRPAIAP